MNEDFRRLNADRINTPAVFQPVAGDPNFEFRLACIDPNGNPTNGITRTFAGVNQFNPLNNRNPDLSINEQATGIKFTNAGGIDAWPTDGYLNIWVCDMGGGLIGYGQFPDDYPVKPNTDGVVMLFNAFGRVGNLLPALDQGRVCVHEIGHWLNLRHIWGDANCGNDFVDDTPAQQTANRGCPGFPHITCNNGPNGDMFMNYMDYTNNGCQNIYTRGQGLRMRAIFAQGGPRAAFIENYFSIQPSNPIQCSGTVNLTNLACLTPVNWTVISGPANIVSGQNTNQITIQATGNGTVQLRATAGNYVSDVNVPVTIPNLIVSGPSSICNNQPGYYSINLPSGGSVVWDASPSGKVYLTVLNSNTVQATPFNSPTGSFTLTATVTSSCITTPVQYPVTFNTTPPPYNCSQVGNGTCTQYVYMCIDQFYAGRGFFVPNKIPEVPYWHWWVSGGTFSNGTTDQIIPAYVPDAIQVRPQWPNTACIVYIRPMSQCMMEDTYEPFKYIMINTNQSCYGYYYLSPNPASSDITISTVESASQSQTDRSITAINVYNQQGIMKKQKKFGKVKTASMSISDLANGTYVVEIISGDYKEQKQLIVQH